MINTTLFVLIVIAFILLLAFSIYVLILIKKVNKLFKAIEMAVVAESEYPIKLKKIITYPISITDHFSHDVAYFCGILIYSLIHIHKKDICYISPIFKSFEYIYFDSKIIGFCAVGQGDIGWICFRGTRTVSEWNKNIRIHQRAFTYNIRAHTGFIEIFNAISHSINKFVKQSGCIQFICTGHSLGAALATLTSIYLKDKVSTYTYIFASPRVVEKMNRTELTNFFRIDNTCDIIPQLPLSVTPNYDSPHNSFNYVHVGQSVLFTTNTGSLGSNHLMPVYLNAIENGKLRI